MHSGSEVEEEENTTVHEVIHLHSICWLFYVEFR